MALVINLYEESNVSIFALLKILVSDRNIITITLYSITILSALIIFPLASAQDNSIYPFIGNNERFSRLGINDSFSLSGSIISTVKATTNIGLNTSIAASDTLMDKSGPDPELIAGFNPLHNSSLSSQMTERNLANMPDFESLLTNSRPSEKINQTNSFSNNLVSMLSGIIVQSIEKGNPTITDSSLNLNNSSKLNNTLKIVSGNWRMNVVNSNVTFFDARLLMITADGTGFHWHLLDNFDSTSDSYFGNDENIFLNGSADFYTDNKVIAKKINVNIFISNLEAIQIILNDKKVSSHFYGYPIYGTIDKVEIPN